MGKLISGTKWHERSSLLIGDSSGQTDPDGANRSTLQIITAEVPNGVLLVFAEDNTPADFGYILLEDGRRLLLEESRAWG